MVVSRIAVVQHAALRIEHTEEHGPVRATRDEMAFQKHLVPSEELLFHASIYSVERRPELSAICTNAK